MGNSLLGPEALTCWDREGHGSGSPHHRTCWASGGRACCIRVSPRGPGRPGRCSLVEGPGLGVGSPCWGPGLEEGLRIQCHLMTVGKGDRCETLQSVRVTS